MSTDQEFDAARDFPAHVLRDYALLADGCRGALVGPRGDVCWMCAPRWDSQAVLSHLIGGDSLFAITPVDPFVWGGSYEPRSLIWGTTFVTTSTRIGCRDALAFPGDEHRAVLLRQVSAPEAGASVRIVLRPAGDFGPRPVSEPRREAENRWTLRVGNLWVRLTGPRHLEYRDGTLEGLVTLPHGAHEDVILEVSDRALGDPVDAARAWATTEQSWHEQVPKLGHTVAPGDAELAYAVLRGLTYPTGAMVAAATLGLPERAEAGRNYDYRYAWLRDQAFTGVACAVDRPLPLLDDAVDFTSSRILADGDLVAPAYRVDGTPIPDETPLGLVGYPGGQVVVGNKVRHQFQLDAVGGVLDLLATAARFDRLDAEHWRAAEVAVGVVERRWNDPDAGVWELDDAWWTQSRLQAVAGLRGIAGAASTPALAALAARADSLADTILAETSRRCLAPDGTWRRSPDHPGVDASLVLPPVRGAVPADDPRTRATLATVVRDLGVDHHVYRFRSDARPLGEAEGAFTLCGFLVSLAELQQGDRVEAFRWFEVNRAACGSPGLLSEEFDVEQRQLRGNLPQAFVHALLLESAQRLA